MEQNEKKEFEISYITRNENGQDVMHAICARHGGTVVQSERSRKIALGYPIKKQTSAFFGVSYVLLDPAAVRQIEQEAKLEQEILRMLVIAEPIKMVRAEREDRRGSAPSPRDEQQQAAPAAAPERTATNEELEKKLEEILG
jgi:ribosomal protein S6